MLKCRYCGYKGNKEEFETTQDGYWCPDCDGFTLYSKDDEPKYWIILEDKNRPGIHIKGSRNISPLRYPGGKTRIAPYLSSLCRQSHLINFCEPFCGSASVGLYPMCRKTPCFSYGDIRHAHQIYAGNPRWTYVFLNSIRLG